MLNLIRNENMKIYRRLRTLILLGLIVLIPIVATIIMHNLSGGKVDENWKEKTQSRIESAQQSLNHNEGMPAVAKEELQKEIAVGQYRLQHNIPPEDEGVWPYVMAMSNLVFIVTIFTVIVAADIVAGEFAGGTIKLLLIRPASRSKILLSKYIATLAFSIVLLAALFITSFVMGGILSGFGDVGTPYLYAGKDLVVHETSMLTHALETYGLTCIELVMVVTLAFMISTVFRSSALSIGISLMIMFVGTNIVMLLRKYTWIKYYLFANTDLTQYINGSPMIEGMTMSFSIVVLIVYFVIFNALSWTIFNKRDVAA